MSIKSHIILSGLVISILFLFSSCLKDLYLDNSDSKSNPEDGNAELPDLSVSSSFNWDSVYVKIPLTDKIDINKIVVSFPILKYNKNLFIVIHSMIAP